MYRKDYYALRFVDIFICLGYDFFFHPDEFEILCKTKNAHIKTNEINYNLYYYKTSNLKCNNDV